MYEPWLSLSILNKPRAKRHNTHITNILQSYRQKYMKKKGFLRKADWRLGKKT